MYPITFHDTRNRFIHLTRDDKKTVCGVDIAPVTKGDIQYERVSRTHNAPTCNRCLQRIKNDISHHLNNNLSLVWEVFQHLGLDK